VTLLYAGESLIYTDEVLKHGKKLPILGPGGMENPRGASDATQDYNLETQLPSQFRSFLFDMLT
jgi:hypothetical protein